MSSTSRWSRLVRAAARRNVQRAHVRSGAIYLRPPRVHVLVVDDRDPSSTLPLRRRVLRELAWGPLTCNELAKKLGRPPSSLTAPLHALEADGEVFRAGRRHSAVSGVVNETWARVPPPARQFVLERWSS